MISVYMTPSDYDLPWQKQLREEIARAGVEAVWLSGTTPIESLIINPAVRGFLSRIPSERRQRAIELWWENDEKVRSLSVRPLAFDDQGQETTGVAASLSINAASVSPVAQRFIALYYLARAQALICNATVAGDGTNAYDVVLASHLGIPIYGVVDSSFVPGWLQYHARCVVSAHRAHETLPVLLQSLMPLPETKTVVESLPE